MDAKGCAVDSDSDGIADYKDSCADTPVGVSVNSKGCGLDSDRDGVADYLDRFASEFGVPLAQPPRIPNTRRALAVTEHARDAGLLPAFRDATMRAHWLEGADIEDDRVLGALAAGAGLDPEAALAAADDPAFWDRIDALREECERLYPGRGDLFEMVYAARFRRLREQWGEPD